MTHNRPHNGFLYLSVLFTSLIVITMATAAFSISTNRLRGEESELDARSALRAAEAESHRVACMISTADLSWRTTSTSGTLCPRRAGDNGAVLASRLTDADADLADDPGDLVELTCFAAVGRAQRAVSCTLQPVIKPLPILDYTLISSGNISVGASGVLACSGKVRCGSSVVLNSAAAASAAQWNVTTSISNSARGEILVSGQALAIPASNITTSYQAIGTQIPITSLTLSGGSRRLRKLIISSTVNPFGAANSEGVYWIDAGGLPIQISECRIEATLVIINSTLVTISAANLWKAPITGGAALMSTAPIRFDQCVRELNESTANVNYNPTNLPYRSISDSDTSDRYPSSIEGLVYTPALFEWTANNAINGMLIRSKIVCGSATIAGVMSIDDDRTSQKTPPLGFRLYDSMRFVRGSWRSVATTGF